MKQLKGDVSELLTRHSYVNGTYLSIPGDFQAFSTEKQEKHEAITVCLSLNSLSLIFGSMLKLERTSCSTRCRANFPLSNAASDILPSICLRKRRSSTFHIEKVQAND
jgi:hypothetical protein